MWEKMKKEDEQKTGKKMEEMIMKLWKHVKAVLLTAGMMALVLTGCGNKEVANTSVEQDATNTEIEQTTDANAQEQRDESTDGEASNEEAGITEEEAINLVKEELGEEFSYIPADELEEKDGSQYYVIYVKTLLEEGNMTTVATYMVKTDGSEYFDKDAVNYTGEYVRTGEVGDVTFVVSEDYTFEMITAGEVNQVVSGGYELGITDSTSVITLKLYPNKNVVDGKEEVIENVEGMAVIEGDTLTLTMESEDTVFTKK